VFDNLFLLLGPIASAVFVLSLLGLASALMFWETCALRRGGRLSR
jgi:hypothetical protein